MHSMWTITLTNTVLKPHVHFRMIFIAVVILLVLLSTPCLMSNSLNVHIDSTPFFSLSYLFALSNVYLIIDLSQIKRDSDSYGPHSLITKDRLLLGYGLLALSVQMKTLIKCSGKSSCSFSSVLAGMQITIMVKTASTSRRITRWQHQYLICACLRIQGGECTIIPQCYWCEL